MQKQLEYGTTILDYDLAYADRKTLGVRVNPEGEIKVIAPVGTEMATIEEKLLSKAAWIRRQRDFFLSFQPRRSERRYVSGETHLYLGKQYRLKVHKVDWDIDEGVRLERGYFHLRTIDPKDRDRSEKLMRHFYEAYAEIRFPALLKARLPASRSFYNGPVKLQMKWLTSRWGMCRRSGSITLNYELMKAPVECIEYVIVHELCHLGEFSHGRAFYELLEREWPEWEKVKERLERMLG
jgi:predicted metal-dependent hydrolase